MLLSFQGIRNVFHLFKNKTFQCINILFFMLAIKIIIEFDLTHFYWVCPCCICQERARNPSFQSDQVAIRCSLIAKRATSFKKRRSKERPAKTGHLGWSGGRIATEPEEKPIRDVTPAACQAALGQGTMAWRNKPINGAIMNANARKIKKKQYLWLKSKGFNL